MLRNTFEAYNVYTMVSAVATLGVLILAIHRNLAMGSEWLSSLFESLELPGILKIFLCHCYANLRLDQNNFKKNMSPVVCPKL